MPWRQRESLKMAAARLYGCLRSTVLTAVLVQRLGDAVLLTPKADAWQTFMSGLNSFTEDFMTDGREPEIPTARESL